MKARLVVETKPQTVIELGAGALASVVSELRDDQSNASVFEALVAHPSSLVREAVANKDSLTAGAVKKLFEDPAVNVLRNVVRSGQARKSATTKQLLSVIAKDVDVAENVAYCIEAYENAEVDTVSAALVKHSDPKVRLAFANNSSAPKKYLKMLQTDLDRDVAAAAKASLS